MSEPLDLDGRCGACLLFGAIQGLEDGLLMVDPEGRVFHVNRAAEQILGVSAIRLNGNPARSALRAAGLLGFWDQAGRDDGPMSTEFTLASGAAIRATASFCRSARGESIGRALILRDVTSEKRIQVDLPAAVARRLVDLAGGDPPGDVASTLTGRERQILGLLAAGLTNAQIAARLKVSPNTVASHLKHLFPKIGVRNRSQAAAYAVARGFRGQSR